MVLSYCSTSQFFSHPPSEPFNLLWHAAAAVGQPLPLSPQNDRNHLPFWASKLKSPLHSARSLSRSCTLLRPPVVFIITRSFFVPGSDTLFDELSEMREEDRGGWRERLNEKKSAWKRLEGKFVLPRVLLGDSGHG